jgi:hypothetical protein
LGSLTVLDNSRETDGERYISPNNTMSKYRTDKERMDIIAERLVHRQDIWQDRYIYWMAVAIGHILEWIVKHGTNGIGADNSITDSDKGE